ncbi:hypothetical protein FIBSPDRAFT_836693 [Athelia psychrophila]|uniref:Vacuole protein n=2 Tax=Athelia psychrophila TaxID=1759441 RepID=A0A166B0A4_9AGAM|nr:hypothetical protein FIBSPDRAFT_836693 [Fibularhizoctonia sp. CBS 109695]
MPGPAWKREKVPDHKFDFVDTREFTDTGFMMRMKYMFIYAIVLKSFLVYVSDIFSAITMLTTDGWSNQIFAQCQNETGCFFIPFSVGKWLFVGCIIFSFLLLAYEGRKSKKIIASRDISYAFTNVMANHYYSLRSYNHFCFFDHISNSTKKKDEFAFFIFFTFKSWKRLLLADGPRQTINALTLYSIYLSKEDDGAWYDIPKYFRKNTISTSALTVTTFFTFVIFAASALLLIVAGIFYIPLLCYIQGNLKEYVCHKVDKRISEVIKRRNKARLAKAAALAKKEAAGDYSHLKNKKGELIAKPLPQPTLPNLSVDDDYDDAASMRTRGPPASTYTKDYDYKSEYKADYPPMPAYNQPYEGHNPNPSATTFGDEYQQPYLYDDDQGSTAHLALAAAPFAQAGPERTGSGMANPYGSQANANYIVDPHDAYQGNDYPNHAQDYPAHAQDYPSPTSGGPQPQQGVPQQQQQYSSMHQQSYEAYGSAYDHPNADPQYQHQQPQEGYYANSYNAQGHPEQGYHHQEQGHNGDAGYAM